MVVIDRKNPIPLYIQLKEFIVQKIENNEWVTGELIPSEIELQNQFNLSRTTVRQALGELVSAGVLERIQGKGTFVAKPKLEPKRPDLTGFTHDMKDKGHQITSEVLKQSVVRSNDKLIKLFRNNNDVFNLERIRYVDGLPVGYHKAFINISVTPFVNLDKYDFSADSLYEALVQEGVVFGEAEETVEADVADDYYAELLNIPTGSPVLILTRTVYLEDGIPYEYTKMVYRSDRYKYSIKLK